MFRTNIALDMAFDDFADCDAVTREHVPLARRLGDPVVGVFAPFFKALQVVELDDQCRLPSSAVNILCSMWLGLCWMRMCIWL